MRVPAAPSSRRPPQSVLERLARIELMIFDVDGVMTDGRLWFDANGEALKVFHVHDGAVLKALAAAGVTTAVLSGRDSPITRRRCEELGLTHVLQGVADKAEAFDALRRRLDKSLDACGFMGDDDVDVPVMRRVGFAATVPGATPGVADFAHWVSRREGGAGAVRELCDLLLAARRSADEELRAPASRSLTA